MRSRFSLVAILYLLAGALPTYANDLEAVLLRHRTVEQVLPVLQPLVDPGGALSGMANQLLIRSNPRNREQLKTALRSIDVPYRRLMVSVRRMSEMDEHPDQARAGVKGRTYSSRAAADDGIVQQVHTVDGVGAFIETEQTVPVQQESVVPTPSGYGVAQSTNLQSAANGFSVVPRIVGDRVILDIRSKRENMRGNPPGTIDADRINGTVTGRLGEWIRLGGGAAADRRVLSSAAVSRPEQRVIWVKVDEVL
jgi:type II secretory pathway component GspD/PulD (secretin)